MRFLAIPQLRLVSDSENLSSIIGHSVLLITDGNSEKHMFDGTTDQYGRNWITHWLMTKEELMRSHMNLGRGFQKRPEGEAAALRARLDGGKYQHGYWAVASRRMEHIFHELDWTTPLRGYTEDDIEARIRSLSKTKLVDAYEEALAQ
jgi:hypothetical protein